jgi:hypothetical protein
MKIRHFQRHGDIDFAGGEQHHLYCWEDLQPIRCATLVGERSGDCLLTRTEMICPGALSDTVEARCG